MLVNINNKLGKLPAQMKEIRKTQGETHLR